MLLNTGFEAVPSKHGLLTTIGYKLGPEDWCEKTETHGDTRRHTETHGDTRRHTETQPEVKLVMRCNERHWERLRAIADIPRNHLDRDFGFQERTTYALEGSVACAGRVVQWLRDNMGIISSSKAQRERGNGCETCETYQTHFWAMFWRAILVARTQLGDVSGSSQGGLEDTPWMPGEGELKVGSTVQLVLL